MHLKDAERLFRDHQIHRPPHRRQLTVLAQDPSIQVGGVPLTTQVWIPEEPLEPGPWGARIQVIDYDGESGDYYPPVSVVPDADHYADPTRWPTLVQDPHFHAQNVYGIAMATLARFERALGREITWGFKDRAHQLKIAPHAFADANAFYSRKHQGLFFGYFYNDDGPVFTCLSHDVVVHEVTHALLDGLRPLYERISHPDQAAFHEGFADVIALLSVFHQPEIVAAALQKLPDPREDGFIDGAQLTPSILSQSFLGGLAQELGASLEPFHNRPLREALAFDYASYQALPEEERNETYTRAAVFVAAVMRAFFDVWAARVEPIIGTQSRLANQGRVVEEGCTAARHLMTMLIRAIDYLPPTDLTFRQFLSGILTADHEICLDEAPYFYRRRLRDAFSAVGITPHCDTSDASRPGCWSPPEALLYYGERRYEAMQSNPEAIYHYVWRNREALGLDARAFTKVISVQPIVRLGPHGFLLRETVAEISQSLYLRAYQLDDYAQGKLTLPDGMADDQPLVLFGGNTLVFDEYGLLKFNIGAGIFSTDQNEKIRTLWEQGHLEHFDNELSFAELHRMRSLPNALSGREAW